MALVAIFSLSGLGIIALLVTKKLSERRKKNIFILGLISKGDRHTRQLYQRILRSYSEIREKVLFLLKRQVPIHSRNSLNKSVTYIKKKRDRYLSSLRDSRLLKKSDGISEFFKNMSSTEKGNGEIHDVYEDTSPNDRSVGRGSQDAEEEVK